ncbi:hypothetical protein [Paraburkholderia sp. BL10I2N1]|uniref:hypothetical protein n=1 Tax=Paraburkholderia sp. BL10I2N1 TaxID=1938796 RepID=UPI001AACDCA7|nr:hypothetical protein [Paraburkholderia sp. BL10I2N1]
MDTSLTTHLTRLLLHAARNRRVLPYTRFHSIFPHTIPLAARHAALASVLEHLSDCQQADYGVLLARDNGLPGPEFFQRFRKHRLDEYTAVVGDPRYHNATMKQQRLIVDTERARVYAHVATHFPVPATQPQKGVFHDVQPIEIEPASCDRNQGGARASGRFRVSGDGSECQP